jgi:hypothetical protein
MRCSSCEPLLDGYLEASLRPRQILEVAQHLRACGGCSALLRELRVIDALLTTVRPPGSVGSNFTATVVSAARVAPASAQRRVRLEVALIAYLAIAWMLTAVVLIRFNDSIASLANFVASEQGSLAALGAALRALAPATPMAAAVVTGILVIDLLLLGALYFGYRRVQPLIALHLTRGARS